MKKLKRKNIKVAVGEVEVAVNLIVLKPNFHHKANKYNNQLSKNNLSIPKHKKHLTIRIPQDKQIKHHFFMIHSLNKCKMFQIKKFFQEDQFYK